LKKLFFSLLLCAAAGAAAAQSWAWDDGTTPYVQSPPEVVDRMLALAQPKPGELVVDLGSGDGRIVIEAAKRYGARGLGVDIDPSLVALARENARKAGVGKLVRFESKDFFELDLAGANVVTAYLLPEVNLKLMPKLLALPPGTRIVTHDYDMGPWAFDEMVELPLAEKLVGPLGRSRIYLFVVPADVRGTWESNLPAHGGHWRFTIAQEYQALDVSASAGAQEQVVRGTRLRGKEIRLVMTGVVAGKPSTQRFHAIVQGDTMKGDVTITNGETTRTLPWTAKRTAR